jgi:anti-anti-sigma factor
MASTDSPQLVVALNVELCQGGRGASARVELHERPDNPPGTRRIAVVALHGWLDAVAVRRLEATLQDLAARGVDQVLLDGARLRHIDYRQTGPLVDALERFEVRAGGIVVCGLSRHLRDLFRLAGCEPRLRLWPSVSDLLEPAERPLQSSGAAAP